jgi:hypothetical protein
MITFTDNAITQRNMLHDFSARKQAQRNRNDFAGAIRLTVEGMMPRA